MTEYWITYPKEQFINAFALTPEGEYELAGTYAEPGAMLAHTLPGLVIEWADIFEELK